MGQKLQELEEILSMNVEALEALEKHNSALQSDHVKKDEEILRLMKDLDTKETLSNSLNEKFKKQTVAMMLKDGALKKMKDGITQKEKRIVSLEQDNLEKDRIANETRIALESIKNEFNSQVKINDDVVKKLEKKDVILKQKASKLSQLEEEIKNKTVTVTGLKSDILRKNKTI